MSANVDPSSAFMELVRPHTGDVSITQPRERGSTDLTAVAEGEKGRFFIKAMRNHPGGRREQMLREKAINPYVRDLAPALLWAAENSEWIVLGFEFVEGRPSDFLPTSPDIPTIVELVNRIGELELPKVARDWREDRWDWWADEGEFALFRGDALLYADVNPDNFIMGRERAWVVDWSWPTRGASFIDPAMLVTQLVAADHTPEAAEAWVASCLAWVNADPKAIDAFALAYARMTRVRATRNPDQPWIAAMANAIESWAYYRGITRIL